jgi:hypothetical protein
MPTRSRAMTNSSTGRSRPLSFASRNSAPLVPAIGDPSCWGAGVAWRRRSCTLSGNREFLVRLRQRREPAWPASIPRWDRGATYRECNRDPRFRI